MSQSLSGDNRAETAIDYSNLCTGLYHMARFHEADAALARGIGLLEFELGNRHPRIGFILSGRAAVLMQLGRFSEATALLDRSDTWLAFTASHPGNGNSERL